MSAPSAPRVAFFAPLKHSGHHVPSGDRAMARLLAAALGRAGTLPEPASTVSSFDGRGDPLAQADRRREAEAEIRRLVAEYRSRAARDRPALWFTYHLYYKAPDLIGPAVADALGLPYVVAEGSLARKRAAGPWAGFHADAERALSQADLHLVLNPGDRPALETLRRPGQRIVDLAPFLDPADWPAVSRDRPAEAHRPVRLISVAMMRDGDKLASYRVLAEALGTVSGDWTLDIVGDGAQRETVAGLFAPFGDRVRLRGLVTDRATLARLYAEADLLVWPAVNEAFGMVFLEAALQGCPALAGRHGGVAAVVEDGVTGLLTEPGDVAGFSRALSRLVADPALRAELSAGARRQVLARHSIDGAARTLRAALGPLLTLGDEPRCAS